jgi:hypothetical protein
LKITVDYIHFGEVKQDALEADYIRAYPGSMFLEVNLSHGKSGSGPTYDEPLSEVTYEKHWKVWYPIHSVVKVVTE